jgi:hypothetical protein
VVSTATNPAKRLHDVLAVAAGSRSNNPAPNVWAGIFNVSLTQPQQFLARASALTEMVAEVRSLVEELPVTEDPELILRNYGQVEQTVANFLRVSGLNMVQFMGPLQDTGLLSVEMADRALRRNGYREPQLDRSQIDDLRDEVHDLISDVVGTDSLTPRDKRAIIAHLRAVEDALTNATLSADQLQRQAEGLVGAILGLPRRAIESDVVRGVAKFAAAVTLAVTVNIATQQIENAIDAPKPASVVILERIERGEAVPAITGSTHGDDSVIEAELVDEGSPH